MTRAARGAAAQSLDREFIRKVNRALLAWYAATARPLKIRERSDPYSVLVSEVMAQQTQISRVDQLATVFLERFPTLESLAAAETADVLVAWKGLGYTDVRLRCSAPPPLQWRLVVCHRALMR